MSQYVKTDPNSLVGVLTSGCDERVFLRPSSNANKYHLNPVEFENLLQRGSCTCNLLTPDGFEVATRYLKEYDSCDYATMTQGQATRLQQLFQHPDNESSHFEVVFGPSGSDMMYVPSLFQTMFQPEPGTEIVNIVTCPEELGSGSRPAAEVKYYAAYNQKGEGIDLNGSVCNGNGKPEIKTKCYYLDARDQEHGSVLERATEVTQMVTTHISTSPVIVNLVFGSKSGIEDELSMIDSLQAKFGTDFKKLMFCVDMCQFRSDVSLLHELISKNVMIMITGSKFYQAPPFCGALLVPTSIASALSSDCQHAASMAGMYQDIFSAHDFPSAYMKGIAAHLQPFENKGLRTRWEVALDEMTKFQQVPEAVSKAAIARWRQVVIGRLAQTDTFKVMPNVNDTSASIVSFQVLRRDGTSLDKAACQSLFDKLALNHQTGLENDYTKVFIGQPVAFGKHAFIRLAIGSYSLRQMMLEPRYNPHNDLRVIQILEDLVQEMFD